MKELRTIPAALKTATEKRGGAGFTFVDGDGSERFFWSFAKLYTRAREIAVALGERGVEKGDRVALVLPKAEEFVPTFLGATCAGAVPVPLYPPMAHRQLAGHYLDHCAYVVGSSRATLLVTTEHIKAVLPTLYEVAPELKGVVVTYAELKGDARLYREPSTTLEDVAYIQFTKGSTPRPKGMALTHSNLAHNTWAIMREGLKTDDHDRAVSWLPLFDDMGLIGFVIAPLMYRIPVTFMEPLAFLRRPTRWLKVLSEHRGTITFAPNFAYALAVKRVQDKEIAGIDLSALRVAGCGAEPNRAPDLEGLRPSLRSVRLWGGGVRTELRHGRDHARGLF